MRRIPLLVVLACVVVAFPATAAPGGLAGATANPNGIAFRIPQTDQHVYLATRNQDPGVVLMIDGAEEKLAYMRPANNLSAFTIGTAIDAATATQFPHLLFFYYCNGFAEKSIWRAPETKQWTDTNIVRSVAFTPDQFLCYSVSPGGGKDGRILVLAPAPRMPGPPGSGAPEPRLLANTRYVVKLAQVGGAWGGHFAFDRDGKLYISNGDVAGAAIWRCPEDGTPPVKVFQGKGPILGFTFANRNTVLFTDGGTQLWRAKLGAADATVEFTSPKGNRYCGVLVK